MKALAVLQKEFQEHKRNYKLVFLIMLIFGGILMALYTEVGPTANSKNVLDPFFELFAVLCPLIGIFAAMDSVVGEKERGTLELVLSKPVSRLNLLLGKFFNYLLIIIPLLAVELILAYYWAQVSGISTYRWNLPMPPFSQWMSMVTILTAVCMYYVALNILISLFARSTAAAGLIGIILMAPAHPLGGEFLKRGLMLLKLNDLSQLPLPAKFMVSIFGKYQKLALTSVGDFWICLVSLLTITIALLLVSGIIFEKQNVTFKA